MKLLPKEFVEFIRVGDYILWVNIQNEDEIYLSKVVMEENRFCVHLFGVEEYLKKSYLHRTEMTIKNDKKYFYVDKGYNIDSWKAYLIENTNDLEKAKSMIALKELKK